MLKCLALKHIILFSSNKCIANREQLAFKIKFEREQQKYKKRKRIGIELHSELKIRILKIRIKRIQRMECGDGISSCICSIVTQS